MPMESTPVEFANALAERRSRTTKALDDLFKRPANLRNHPHIGDLRRAGRLNAPLPTWIKNELKARGVLKPGEFRHINQWPKTHKERLRRAMIHAIDNNVKMRFFFELYGGSTEQTIIVPDPLPASPWNKNKAKWAAPAAGCGLNPHFSRYCIVIPRNFRNRPTKEHLKPQKFLSLILNP